jgi:hypothetical protein
MVKKVKGIAVIIKKLRVAVLLQILVVKKISAAAAKTGVVALAFAHPEDELRQETRAGGRKERRAAGSGCFPEGE